jgi:hypothetical protein
MNILNTYTFNCTFICANTDEQKQLVKEYRAKNYLDAKIGMREHFRDNKTITKLLELELIK